MDATLNSLYINIDSNFQKNQERFIKDLKEKKEESLLKLDDLELQVTDDKFENTIDQDEKTMIIELERVEE
jgi:EAL domain-containing protein (putative c-di-GMP-specific phosphodiesterase class I)